MVDKLIFDGLLARALARGAVQGHAGPYGLTVRVLLSMMRWKCVSSSRFSLAGR
jgi:hypothetical protein